MRPDDLGERYRFKPTRPTSDTSIHGIPPRGYIGPGRTERGSQARRDRLLSRSLAPVDPFRRSGWETAFFFWSKMLPALALAAGAATVFYIAAHAIGTVLSGVQPG